MKFIAHLLFAAFLAAFAASSVAYAAGSGKMAAAMVLFDEAMEMDCTPCEGSDADGSAVACDIECGAGGFAAVLAPQTQSAFHSSRDVFRPATAQTFGGLTGPPAKQPPRSLI